MIRRSSKEWYSGRCRSLVAASLFLLSSLGLAAPDVLVVGGEGRNCNEDPACINRLHPAIPMAARARPGQTILFKTRNASDFDLDPDSTYDDPRKGDALFGTVHPLTGPVHIEGAEPGDALAVTLVKIEPGRFGVTFITGNGFVSDRIPGPLRVVWRLNRHEAVSDDLPGVRIPNGSFPGVVTVLPGPGEHAAMLEREEALKAAGGTVYLPHTTHATPAEVCGPEGTKKDECLRTIPPREHGGNMDIRHLGVGVTIYLPCFVEGCGLAVGDLHYAQGDGEVAGTAIEMDADVTLTTRLVKGKGKTMSGPHYEGPSTLLDIPSRKFYATTGLPLKERGSLPPNMEYLESSQAPGLANLSKDLGLAARNALLEMIDHIATTYGLTRQQAYIVASVAVDLRIGQLVDAPNFGVTAILPLDIFQFPAEAAGFQGHHYLVVDPVEDVSWSKGKEHCEARGATLAVVTSKEEAEFIAGLSDGRYLFLGASDQKEEGIWAWVDGTPWRYTHWMQGQPNDYSGHEDFLATYDDGEWVDVDHEGQSFWMPTGFLCEWAE